MVSGLLPFLVSPVSPSLLLSFSPSLLLPFSPSLRLPTSALCCRRYLPIFRHVEPPRASVCNLSSLIPLQYNRCQVKHESAGLSKEDKTRAGKARNQLDQLQVRYDIKWESTGP